MININDRYLESEEAGRRKEPYEDFYKCIKNTFDIKEFKSFVDIGCADGHLLEIISRENPDIDVRGLEYFDYHKKYAANSIVEKIKILDIRLPLSNEYNKKYDMVVCTEVGEHIDPEYCDSFMKNVKSLSSKYLIMTWSCHGGINDLQHDPHHQHLNPLSIDEYIRLISSYGYKLDVEKTNIFLKFTDNLKNFFPWWKESLRIWKLSND